MPAVVRTATGRDWTAIGELLAGAGLPTADLGAANMREFLVAESAAGNRVGAIGFERYGACGLLRSLVVAESARGSGLGRALVDHLEREVARQGVTELWLLTIDAHGFFGRLGYAPAARSEAPAAIRGTAEFSRLCPDDAHLMRKVLA